MELPIIVPKDFTQTLTCIEHKDTCLHSWLFTYTIMLLLTPTDRIWCSFVQTTIKILRGENFSIIAYHCLHSWLFTWNAPTHPHRQDMMFIIVQTTMETDRCNLIIKEKGIGNVSSAIYHLCFPWFTRDWLTTMRKQYNHPAAEFVLIFHLRPNASSNENWDILVRPCMLYGSVSTGYSIDSRGRGLETAHVLPCIALVNSDPMRVAFRKC